MYIHNINQKEVRSNDIEFILNNIQNHQINTIKNKININDNNNSFKSI